MKNHQILMQFSLLGLMMNDTWRYELHPRHLINVATLPCESRNSENVILQWDIAKENCIKCIVYASWKWTRRSIKFGMLCSNACTKQRFVTSTGMTCKKCLTQTWIDSEQNVMEAATDQWHDRLRSCVHPSGRHFEHMLWNYCLFVLCGSSEYFMKLSM